MRTRTKRRRPTSTTGNTLNRTVTLLARLGISLWGSRLLSVRGRSSGRWRSTPVNVLVIGGETFLVAPRGQTQWVRNLRVAGTGQLRLGRRTRWFVATECADRDKPEVLRAYLRRWKFEVAPLFDGLGRDSTLEEFGRQASRYPVFRITVR